MRVLFQEFINYLDSECLLIIRSLVYLTYFEMGYKNIK